MSLRKELTKVIVSHEKDSIISFAAIVQEFWLLIWAFDVVPESIVFLAALSLPLSLTPWISQYHHFVLFPSLAFKNPSMNLEISNIVPRYKHAQPPIQFFPSQYRHYHQFHNSRDDLSSRGLEYVSKAFPFIPKYSSSNAFLLEHRSQLWTLQWDCPILYSHNFHEPSPKLFRELAPKTSFGLADRRGALLFCWLVCNRQLKFIE